MMMMNTSDKKPDNSSPIGELLTLDNVAAKLKVSKKTVTRWWKDGDRENLPFPKPAVFGRFPRWLESDIDRWILATRDRTPQSVRTAEHAAGEPIRKPLAVVRAG